MSTFTGEDRSLKDHEWHRVSKEYCSVSHLHEQEASEETGRHQIHSLTILFSLSCNFLRHSIMDARIILSLRGKWTN